MLPVNALGNQYYSMNYINPQNAYGKNFITLVATEDNTRIFIRLKNKELIPEGVLLAHAGDVYEYYNVADLTGAYVRTDGTSCNNFAVFSGNSGVKIYYTDLCDAQTLDPLYQQCYPVESWGYTYGYIPFSMESTVAYPVRTGGQIVRVIAKDDGTIVKFNGAVVATLNSGEFYATSKALAQPAYIEANKPVSAAQFAQSRDCSNWPDYLSIGTLGDPDMVLLNPVNYNIKDITIYSSNKEKIQQQFVNILIKTKDAASFRINNAPPSKPFQTFTAMPGYSYIQLLLPKEADGNFHLQADGGFNAIAYGFGEVESYAYSAGTNMATNHKISGYSELLQKEIDNACVDDNFYFRLVLSYLSPKITWQLDAKEQPVIQQNPAATEIMENGRTAYVYRFPKSPAYNQPGNHEVKIIADYNIAKCGANSQNINYIFTSHAQPIPDFKAAMDCFNSYRFTGQSTGDGPLQYDWNFGDPGSGTSNTSGEENPQHLFSANGTFQVTLTVKSSYGCSATKTIPLVIQNFVPTFSSSSPLCAGNQIIFTDLNGSAVFGPDKWQWDFGDGSPILETSIKTAQHTYLLSGKFTVRLQLINSKGCISGAFEQILTINPDILADFTFTQDCNQDAFTSFNNNSSVTSNAILNYKWDFGDPQSLSNESTDKNPKHQFSGPGNYDVLLTVNSDQGCKKTVVKKMIINGPLKVDFEVISGLSICGTQVILKNTSNVTGLSSLEVYYDALNKPDQKTIISQPQAGQILTFDYPTLTGNESRIHLIKVIAYTTAGCFDQKEASITQFPSPVISFPAVQPLCITAQPLQLKAVEQYGQSGLGKYLGNGVTESGLFSPAIAGIGSHEIRFEFTTNGNCIDSKKQFINVLSEPIINDQNFTTKAGTSITLHPQYQGDNLSYSWEPATTLDLSNIAYPTSNALESTAYRLTITNGACMATAIINLKVIHEPLVRNTFTPNGDGKNDFWEIDNLEVYPKVVVDVFNRYGIVVFHTTEPSNYWDGKYKGQNVPAGTYYYTINLGNGKKPFSGYVTVLR
ncbi:PKD domain-containing protein [Mucilaginibacter phyllosphaerae]|uniref:PKD domain-containing protein n=1 Tax=Mucilaginibacter phyllosphaerae TaxID=1812349 RepID=UPI0021D19385|nr:PKD domain-containing protein [Mucilaginibacter phyllosphaerae]